MIKMLLYFQQKGRHTEKSVNIGHIQNILKRYQQRNVAQILSVCFLFPWLSAKNYLIDSQNNQSACVEGVSHPIPEAPIMDLFCCCVSRAELKALQYIPEICHFIACSATGSGQQDKIEEDQAQRTIQSHLFCCTLRAT